MQKGIPSIQKIEKRRLFEKIRSSITAQRRKEVASAIAAHFGTTRPLLSFSSSGTEIDLSLLNKRLAEKNLLFLPKIEKETLALYQVSRLEHMQASTSYGFQEPNPLFCRKADLSEIDAILVPGLAFDGDHYRLGYGKGHYDRFLAHINVRTIGVGFKEQLSEEPLPRDPWDIPVGELVLL